MDIPACYTKHLWVQVPFGPAGEFSLAIRSHYVNVSGNMNLRVTIKEICHPTRSSEPLPLLCRSMGHPYMQGVWVNIHR